MTTSILIILNVVMSLLAFGAVAGGVVLGWLLRPGKDHRGRRASGRDHRDHRIVAAHPAAEPSG